MAQSSQFLPGFQLFRHGHDHPTDYVVVAVHILSFSIRQRSCNSESRSGWRSTFKVRDAFDVYGFWRRAAVKTTARIPASAQLNPTHTS